MIIIVTMMICSKTRVFFYLFNNYCPGKGNTTTTTKNPFPCDIPCFVISGTDKSFVKSKL